MKCKQKNLTRLQISKFTKVTMHEALTLLQKEHPSLQIINLKKSAKRDEYVLNLTNVLIELAAY